eukprot:Opistho-2@92526
MLAAAVALLLKEGQRVVLVPNAGDIVDDPTVCLRASFAMAFPELIDDIALCDRVEDLANLVGGKNLNFLLVVDQLNALEVNAGLGSEADRAMRDIRSIRCSSVRSRSIREQCQCDDICAETTR